MKRIMVAALTILGLSLAAPRASEAQVRVSINLGHGPRWGYGHRAYAPRVYHSRAAYYRCGYYGCGREVVVVRPYRPRPVVVVRDRYHRGRRYR